MALPARVYLTLHETSARWGCNIADIAGWADAGRFRILTGITAVLCGDEVFAGKVTLSPMELMPLFRRCGTGPLEGIMRRIQPTILQEVGQAFRENGLTAAITALVGGSLAIAATVTRKAFTNEAMLERLDRELHLERERTDKQRADDRKADADRLERIETDIRAMRDVMFEAFQRGRTD